MPKLSIVVDYLAFLRQNKKWWLLPLVVVLLALGVLVVLTQGTALAPFIYALF
jgi:NAD/NADP transhydrogenase beta subunit